ncbi:MAG: hypothetical protein AAGL98_08165, partial [Planctomycetota bacterium]
MAAFDSRIDDARAVAETALLPDEVPPPDPDTTPVTTTVSNSYDYGGSSISLGSSETAASIVAVAGLVQFGKNNVGVSIVSTDINRTLAADISGVAVDAGAGTVNAKASDGGRIAGVAVGVGVATGTFAGQASIVTNRIHSNTTATLGRTGTPSTATTVNAGNVNVEASTTSNIRGAAGTLAIGTQASALGVSVLTNTINQDVTSEIRAAQVTASGDVIVDARSSSSIYATAIGVAVTNAGSFGAAGSLTTNVTDNDISARIAEGSVVAAENNVGVHAANDDHNAVIAGSLGVSFDANGIGVSIVVSDIKGDTIAEVTGAGTQVDAKGTNAASKLSVNTGDLASALNLGNFEAPTDNTPNLTQATRQMNGLAVTASSGQAIVSNAVTIALAATTGTAVQLTSITSVLKGETKAAITNAAINQNLTAGQTPEVFVGAGSHTYAGNFGFAGGTLSTNVMDRTTLAQVT